MLWLKWGLLIWFVAVIAFIPFWRAFIRLRGDDDPYQQWLDDNEQMRWISRWQRVKEQQRQEKERRGKNASGAPSQN